MAKKLTVNFVCQTLDIGGAEIFNLDLMTELQQQGIALNCYTTEPRFVKLLQKNQLQAEQIPVILDLVGDWKGLLKAGFYLPKALWYYWQLVRKNRATDLFLLSSFTEKIIVSPLAAWYQIPVVWLEFGPLYPVLNKFLGFPKLLYWLVKDLPAAVIIPSQHTKKDVLKTGRIWTKKISFIPCGRKISKTQLAKYQRLKIQPNTVVCVSRLEKGKGQDLLLQAFKIVVTQIPQAKLVMTGDSPWLPYLKKLATKLGLNSSVQFVGRVPDALKLMAQSAVCVFPTVWELEGFGLVVIEAMALGKPVIAYANGPVPEIINHKQNGLLVKKGNIPALAKQLLCVLTNKRLAENLARQGQTDFTNQYQITPVAKKYIQLFLNVVSNDQTVD
ncbi:MAG: hypothetical protein COY81_02800 [Candidatus Pacebacteria bacterium CG_4_10_14_0_8_um_filter_43_12]|nr:MAG: hypothetical protein COY81_02800 [Candidatus Pacebacteria bacterium CG_4_10_14_0_8_um_filter_43_12]